MKTRWIYLMALVALIASSSSTQANPKPVQQDCMNEVVPSAAETDDGVLVSWDDSCNDVTEYHVWRQNDAEDCSTGTYSEIDTLDIDDVASGTDCQDHPGPPAQCPEYLDETEGLCGTVCYEIVAHKHAGPNTFSSSSERTSVQLADCNGGGGPAEGDCEAVTDGRTIGFWGNKNGQALITADDLQVLRDANLRNEDGTDFDPTQKSQLVTFLRKARGVNMANMLSAQLAALLLNVEHGFVNPDAIICDIDHEPTATTVQSLIDDADTSLGDYANTPAGHTERDHQEGLKTLIDQLNNNELFLQ